MQLAGVELTHPDKLLYPDFQVTKQQVAEYYMQVSDYILPYLQHRPVTLVRSPEGVGKGVFSQRHPGEYFPDYIERIRVEGKTETEIYITIDASNDLVYLVNQGVLEFHAWGAQNHDLDHPDQLIWDLDPGEDAPWQFVIAAAQEIKSKLDKLHLTSFVKVSGSKGLHVTLPLQPQHTWDEGKAFALSLAQQLADAAPEQFTTELSKNKRRGKVFIDYLRNSKGATAVAPYSLRAKSKPAVALPITWEQVDAKLRPDEVMMDQITQRLASAAKAWQSFSQAAQTLPKKG